MIFQDAMKSLKRDFSRSFFYWLTFMLTTTFIFLFFAIATGDEVGVTFIRSTGGLAMNVTFFVVAVCMIDVFFANDFFVKTKSRDLAIQLICGARFLQLAEYLLAQTFILLLIAIPVGLAIAFALMPILSAVFSSYLNATISITINSSCFWATFVVLLTLVFWTTYLNISYAYRNNALTLLNEQQIRTGGRKTKLFNMGTVNQSFDTTMKIMDERSAVPDAAKQASALNGYNIGATNETPKPAEKSKPKEKKTGGIRKYLSAICSLVLFVAPLILMFTDTENIMLFSVIGMLGFLLCITNVILPFLDYRLNIQKIDNPNAVASLGFLRTDIQMMRMNVILIVLSSVILISILVTSDGDAMNRLLILVSYITMNVLLSSAIMFRFATDITTRQKYFQTMSQIGYMQKDLKKIILKETTEFYAFVAIASFLYIGIIFTILVGNGMLQSEFILFLSLAFFIPLFICFIITLGYYSKAVKVIKQR